jgi:hypothetical protein
MADRSWTELSSVGFDESPLVDAADSLDSGCGIDVVLLVHSSSDEHDVSGAGSAVT